MSLRRRFWVPCLLLFGAAAWLIVGPPGREGAVGPGPGVPPAPAPPTTPYTNAAEGVAYVGDAACARCHADVVESYASHPMGRSAAPASADRPGPAGVVLDEPGLSYEIENRDGQVFHRERLKGPSGTVVSETVARVLYALGSGTRGTAYVVEHEGELRLSPVAWYAAGEKWDLSPGYRLTNFHFDRKVSLTCLSCHVNRVEEVPGGPPVVQGLTIGCERCHGPGGLHAGGGTIVDGKDLSVVNPADLTPALRDAVCEQCHVQVNDAGAGDAVGRGRLAYRPGLPFLNLFVGGARDSRPDPTGRRNSVGHFEQMRDSACYRGSAGRLGCVSCHDPHRSPPPEERPAFYRDRCLACHAPDGRTCALPPDGRRATGPPDDCVACHMPKREGADIGHTSFTNHEVRRVPAAGR